MRQNFIFTSESVTEGHPDKLCDLISDAIVDRFLQQDPCARITAQCALAQSIVFVAAHFSSTALIDIPQVVRDVITQVGYNEEGFNGKTCTVLTSLNDVPLDPSRRYDEHSLDEAGVEAVGARNQVNVFGFACRQSPGLLPMPIWLAHKLARRLSAVRFQGILPYLAPDGRAQVGVEYRQGRPVRVNSVNLQVCLRATAGAVDPDRLGNEVRAAVIEPAFFGEEIQPDGTTLVMVRSGGSFLPCGPTAHSGLTGRKNAIDTYGEYARHSGAALSGKDPNRIDRTGAYAARYAARNLVAAGLAGECEVHLSYAVGVARPVSVQVESFGTGHLDDEALGHLVRRQFDFRPAAILRQFRLRHLPASVKGGFYRKLAAYGQVGRMDMGLPWEVTDRLAALRAEAGLAARAGG
ncbi:MAG: methionine adenosyltransferase [Thermodesulfobacteriota bacterium]